METWMDEFASQLRLAIQQHPNEYRFTEAEVPRTLERMRLAFRDGTFAKDTRAVKATCKRLGIKCTYKDIARFIVNHE